MKYQAGICDAQAPRHSEKADRIGANPYGCTETCEGGESALGSWNRLSLLIGLLVVPGCLEAVGDDPVLSHGQFEDLWV